MNATESKSVKEVAGKDISTKSRTHLSLKERQRKEREVLILTTAEEIFLEKGFYDTSMDEIAARVGIAKGTVYLHFPGKEELVIAILERDMQSFLQEIDAIVSSDEHATPRAKLEAVLNSMHAGLFSKQAQLFSTIYSGVDLKHKIMEQGCLMQELYKDVATRMIALLEQGKAANEFDSSIPTQIMLMIIFGIFSPRSYQKLLLDGSISQVEIGKHLVHACFDGITARKNAA